MNNGFHTVVLRARWPLAAVVLAVVTASALAVNLDLTIPPAPDRPWIVPDTATYSAIASGHSAAARSAGQPGLEIDPAKAYELAELTDIAGGNVRADELARAKENLKGRILLSLESTSSRMTRLGKSTITDTPLLTPEQIVKRLEAVTAGEVAELADALLAPERLSVAGIGPDEARFADAAEGVNPALAARAA